MAPVGNLVEDILFMQRSFSFLQFSFVSKTCNKTVQVLAIEVLSSISAQVWLEDYLACILTFIQFDSIQ